MRVIGKARIAQALYDAVEAVHSQTAKRKITGDLAEGRRQAAIEVEAYCHAILHLSPPKAPND